MGKAPACRDAYLSNTTRLVLRRSSIGPRSDRRSGCRSETGIRLFEGVAEAPPPEELRGRLGSPSVILSEDVSQSFTCPNEHVRKEKKRSLGIDRRNHNEDPTDGTKDPLISTFVVMKKSISDTKRCCIPRLRQIKELNPSYRHTGSSGVTIRRQNK